MPVDSPSALEPSSVLLYGGTVLCFDEKNSVLRQCEMLVQRGVIASLGRSLTLMPGTRLIDVTGHLVIPGLIEPHTRLGSWAIEVESPAELARLEAAHDDESAHALGLEAAVRALGQGVTTVYDDGLPTAHGGLQRALGESGLRVAVGGSPSANREPRKLGLEALRGQAAGDPSSSSLEKLSRATSGAATNLGVSADLGSIEVGKWADLVVLSLDPDLAADASDERLYDLVLDAQAEVRHVLVAGTAVISDGRPANHDPEQVRQQAQAQQAALRGRASA